MQLKQKKCLKGIAHKKIGYGHKKSRDCQLTDVKKSNCTKDEESALVHFLHSETWKGGAT